MASSRTRAYKGTWKELVDLNVLDAFETENSICRTQSVLERIQKETKTLATKKDVSPKVLFTKKILNFFIFYYFFFRDIDAAYAKEKTLV
jgi:hypothetical protein